MTDVRLTATNPADSSVVPVACNAKGELLLEDPNLSANDYVAKTGDNMTGDLTLGDGADDKITLDATNGSIKAGDSTFAVVRAGTGNSVMSETSANQSGSLRLTAGSADEYIPLTLTNSSTEIVGKFTTFGDNCKLDLGKGSPAITLNSNGGYGTFAGTVSIGEVIATEGHATLEAGLIYSQRKSTDSTSNVFAGGYGGNVTSEIGAGGTAIFTSDVVVGSRNKKWMIVESNGLAHLVEQTRVAVPADVPDDEAARYPELRNIPQELDLIEKALGDVMEKLRMKPPAGWPIWDGSDEI